MFRKWELYESCHLMMVEVLNIAWGTVSKVPRLVDIYRKLNKYGYYRYKIKLAKY